MCKMLVALLDSTANFKLNFKYEISEKDVSYDGFGFGYFSNEKNNFEIIKKPLNKDNPKGKFSEKHSVCSDNLIAHIRYASSKNVDYDNTHPFVQNRFMIGFNGSTPKNLEQNQLLNGMRNILSFFPSSNKIKEIFEGIGKNLSKVENSYTIKYFIDEFFLLNGIDSPDKINTDFLKKFKSLLKETNKILRLNLFIMFDDFLIVYQDDNAHNRLVLINIEQNLPANLTKQKHNLSDSNFEKYFIFIKNQDLDISCEIINNTKGYIFLTENISYDIKICESPKDEGIKLKANPLNNSELVCLREGEILFRV